MLNLYIYILFIKRHDDIMLHIISDVFFNYILFNIVFTAPSRKQSFYVLCFNKIESHCSHKKNICFLTALKINHVYHVYVLALLRHSKKVRGWIRGLSVWSLHPPHQRDCE